MTIYNASGAYSQSAVTYNQAPGEAAMSTTSELSGAGTIRASGALTSSGTLTGSGMVVFAATAAFTSTSGLTSSGLTPALDRDANLTTQSALTSSASPEMVDVGTLATATQLSGTGGVYITPIVYVPLPVYQQQARRPKPFSRWRYVFADLRTDQTIDEFDVANARFDVRINQPGTFSGTIPLPNAAAAARARAITEVRTVVYVYRGADIWGGPFILWQVTPSGGGRNGVSLSVQGSTFESYLDRREIRTNLTYAQVDQFTIARSLIASAQSRTEGNLGITWGTHLSGVKRDRTYLASESASYGQRLSELAAVLNGFEYRIVGYVDPTTGARVREFVTGYPGLGRPDVEHVFSEPGNVLSWSYAGDGTRGATSFRARGDSVSSDVSGDATALLSDVVERADLLADGWPLLDRTDDYYSVVLKPTLDEYASENATIYGGAARVMYASVRLPYGRDAFSPGNVGDRARLVLKNDWFGVFSQSWRVVGMDVEPNDRSDGQDSATLIFESET